MENIKLLHGDCLELMKDIPDESIDVILTDPPYQYLKNQKLDIPFDEKIFFDEVKRVLKRGGFIVMFGRGTAFYRWNCTLADLDFNFKEEIVWNKRYSTSPLLPLHRIHETLSIYCKGKGKIRRVKIPYVEMKQFDIESIITDIKRLKSAFGNTKHFDAVMEFLKNNNKYAESSKGAAPTLQHGYDKQINRVTAIMQSVSDGMCEKDIIRTDRHSDVKFSKYEITADKRKKTGNRCCNIMQSMTFGMNEKDIISERRDHYKTIHPTQKPVRLLERLLNLVCSEGATVLDPFMGSGSTGIACMNTGRKFIGMEIDEEYFTAARERIADAKAEG